MRDHHGKNTILVCLILSLCLLLSSCETDRPIEKPDEGKGADEVDTEETVSGSPEEDGEDKTEEENEENLKEESGEALSDGKEGRYKDKHLTLSLKDSGYDVFLPRSKAAYDYRYGPSMLLSDEGLIYAYFASPGDSSRELDWITCRSSSDLGKTWSEEKIVLCPNPQSRDQLSVCDPDVFFYDGYYYLGYTATMDATENGTVNNVFIARSPDPLGPFEKWNGEGWGGDPVPLICYDGVWNGWGAGEPAFVIRDEEIFVYSTLDSFSEENRRVKSTVVHTADVTKKDWPSSLRFAGYAVIRTDMDSTSEEDGYEYFECDSWDAAYVEEYDKFLAICTNRRLRNDSCLLYYESDDGLSFRRISEINTNVCRACHNAGLMSDANGHIKPQDPVVVGYAYAGSEGAAWGVWATRFAEADLGISDEIEREDEGKDNLYASVGRSGWKSNAGVSFINSENLVIDLYENGAGFTPSCFWIDENRARHSLVASKIEYDIPDTGVVKTGDEPGELYPVSEGSSVVKIRYKDVSRSIKVNVIKAGEPYSSSDKIKELIAPCYDYYVSLSTPYAVAIRPIIRYGDNRLYEPDLIGIRSCGIDFYSQDERVCQARSDGMLLPVSEGTTYIIVTCSSGESFTVRVTVTV